MTSSIAPARAKYHPKLLKSPETMHYPDLYDFLRPMFSKPKSIIRSMAANGVLLTGQHALEFFRPGSCTPGSPLVFVVPDSRDCISAFLLALEKDGVVLKSIFEPFHDLVASPQARTMNVMWYDMLWYLKIGLFQSSDDWKRFVGRASARTPSKRFVADPDVLILLFRAAIEMRDIYYNSDTRSKASKVKHGLSPSVFIAGNSKLMVHHNEPKDGTVQLHSLNLLHIDPCVVHGETTSGSKSVKVQIVTHLGRAPIEYIYASEYTHLQCFISSHGAINLYHKMTAEGITHAWRTVNDSSSLQPGFSLTGPPKQRPHHVLRQLIQASSCKGVQIDARPFEGARHIPFRHWYDLPIGPKLDEAHKEALGALKWLKDPFRPTDILRQGTGSEKTCVEHFTHKGFMSVPAAKALMHPYIGAYVARRMTVMKKRTERIDPPEKFELSKGNLPSRTLYCLRSLGPEVFGPPSPFYTSPKVYASLKPFADTLYKLRFA